MLAPPGRWVSFLRSQWSQHIIHAPPMASSHLLVGQACISGKDLVISWLPMSCWVTLPGPEVQRTGRVGRVLGGGLSWAYPLQHQHPTCCPGLEPLTPLLTSFSGSFSKSRGPPSEMMLSTRSGLYTVTVTCPPQCPLDPRLGPQLETPESQCVELLRDARGRSSGLGVTWGTLRAPDPSCRSRGEP